MKQRILSYGKVPEKRPRQWKLCRLSALECYHEHHDRQDGPNLWVVLKSRGADSFFKNVVLN